MFRLTAWRPNRGARICESEHCEPFREDYISERELKLAHRTSTKKSSVRLGCVEAVDSPECV